MFELTQRQRLAAIILLGFLILGGAILFIKGKNQNARVYQVDAKADRIYVHICGAVAKPGVIQLKPATRVFEAMKFAGGCLAEADLSQVNLAAFVEDGSQIYVPKRGEVLTGNRKRRTGNMTSLSKSSPSSKSGKPPTTTTAKPKGPFDLNTATQEQLEAVPGIGPSLAGRILQYRKEHGSFATYADLIKVAGIGPAKLEQFRSYLLVP